MAERIAIMASALKVDVTPGEKNSKFNMWLMALVTALVNSDQEFRDKIWDEACKEYEDKIRGRQV